MYYNRCTVEIDGSDMSVVEAGSGPAVVLGSGFLWDAEMWRPQIEALAARYRVIVPELWGHGRSGPMPEGTGSVRDIARQHLALLDKLGIGRSAIVGLSLGGMWGAEMALMAPDRVTALVLMDTSLAAEPAETRDAYFGMLDAIEQQRGFPEPVLAAAAPLFFSPDIQARDPLLRDGFVARLRAWDPARIVDSVVPLGRLIFGRPDALDDLRALAMPALVATGADDQARSLQEGRAMADRIGCVFVQIPHAGHSASLEAPDAVNRLLLGFLADAVAPQMGEAVC